MKRAILLSVLLCLSVLYMDAQFIEFHSTVKPFNPPVTNLDDIKSLDPGRNLNLSEPEQSIIETRTVTGYILKESGYIKSKI